MATPFSSSSAKSERLSECCGSESGTKLPALPILPHELIVQILSRLPAKTLIKFRCVCKSFKTLISCPDFIKTHLKNVKNLSKTNPSDFSERLLVSTYSENQAFKSYSIYSIFRSPEADVIELEPTDLYLYPDKTLCRFVGSCDGLLCLLFVCSQVILWNPTTGVINRLPRFPRMRPDDITIRSFGFGYDGEMDDYMVVATLSKPVDGGTVIETWVKVYSLNNRCWRSIENFEYGQPTGHGIHVRGNLCWLVDPDDSNESRWTIVTLDLAKETFKEVLQPDFGEDDHYYLQLGVVNGLLFLICDNDGADVWIMKEFGVQESWTKMFHIPYLEDTDEWRYLPPLYIHDEGDILLNFKMAFSIYNQNDGTLRCTMINSHCGHPYLRGQEVVYLESLVSPYAVNNQH